MVDIIFTPASFNTAYRTFAVEHGQDAQQAKIQAQDTANQNASVIALAKAEATDMMVISPQAAMLFAEQVRAQKAVSATSEPSSSEASSGSTTPDSEGELADPTALSESENT